VGAFTFHVSRDAEAMSVVEFERRVGELLRARGLTLALAESCTGGLIAHRITNVSGSSDYFLGGVVAYSNDAKEHILGVQHETLLKYGAVSEPTAREMAQGARRVLHADVAVSVTGIAGPTGGTPEKPVGLTFTGLSTRDGEWCERNVWQGDRESNKAQAAEAALNLLYRYLAGELTDRPGFEPSTVEARLDAEGRPTPQVFTWRGQRLGVRDLGRRWTEPVTGGVAWCVLVMTADQSVFELHHTPHDGRWVVRRISSRPAMV
jgi:nicotinamide-nucleotide amidase